MRGSKLGPVVLGFLWTLAPMLVVERLANYYYLSRNPLFYLISGWRIEVFIISALVGPLCAGVLLKEFKLVLGSQMAALGAFLGAVYVFCDPRVCYSTSPDGLEPARLALFLGSVVVSGSALGTSLRGEKVGPKWRTATVAAASLVAVTWYPVVFTMAGAKLLAPSDPLATLAVVFLAAFSVCSMSSRSLGRFEGTAVVTTSAIISVGLCLGMALGYLGTIWTLSVAIIVVTAAGAAMGGRFSSPKWEKPARTILVLSILLVLLMTLAVIPDAVAGVVVSGNGGADGLSIGTPVYAGAYMVAPQGVAYGAMVTVNYSGTAQASIGEGNFLAAGIGVHSPNCCVDGIDFAYRSDVYLFRGGNESVVATGWETCDDNAACGGHSWKVLLFSSRAVIGSHPGEAVTMRMVWDRGTLLWSYSLGGGPFIDSGAFEVPGQEDHGFNTGVSGSVSLSEQKGAYFYQFGILSASPLSGGGAKVEFTCPAVLVQGDWTCISHASTLKGADSYWKVIWRWGEDYPNISISSVGGDRAIFEYTQGNATSSFRTLW